MKAKEDVLKEKKNFKEIVDHLGKGGIVYCYKYDMHVIGVFDTIIKKELYLGDIDTKKIYLVIDYRDIDDMEDYSLYRFDKHLEEVDKIYQEEKQNNDEWDIVDHYQCEDCGKYNIKNAICCNKEVVFVGRFCNDRVKYID